MRVLVVNPGLLAGVVGAGIAVGIEGRSRRRHGITRLEWIVLAGLIWLAGMTKRRRRVRGRGLWSSRFGESGCWREQDRASRKQGEAAISSESSSCFPRPWVRTPQKKVQGYLAAMREALATVLRSRAPLRLRTVWGSSAGDIRRALVASNRSQVHANWPAAANEPPQAIVSICDMFPLLGASAPSIFLISKEQSRAGGR